VAGGTSFRAGQRRHSTSTCARTLAQGGGPWEACWPGLDERRPSRRAAAAPGPNAAFACCARMAGGTTT